MTIDCADPPRLAEFWAAALRWEVAHGNRDGAYCRPPGGGPGLEFVRVAEPNSLKNRVHLGTRAHDIDAETARLVALGASVAWEEEFPEGWPYCNVVLRDPEGRVLPWQRAGPLARKARLRPRFGPPPVT
jgi:predicted enzyme related to lactoylglutathione lyase